MWQQFSFSCNVAAAGDVCVDYCSTYYKAVRGWSISMCVFITAGTDLVWYNAVSLFAWGGGDISRCHSNRGVSTVSRCAADLEIAERL